MKNRKNGAYMHNVSREHRQVVAFIAPLYFFALFIAGLLLSFIFK